MQTPAFFGVFFLRTVKYYPDELQHWGVKGMKWGIRRYQNPDGSLTEEGKKRYSSDSDNKHLIGDTAKTLVRNFGVNYAQSFGIGFLGGAAGGAAIALGAPAVGAALMTIGSIAANANSLYNWIDTGIHLAKGLRGAMNATPASELKKN